MAFDIDMIKNVYSSIVKNVDSIRNIIDKPLTLSEKILYSHLWSSSDKPFVRGKPKIRRNEPCPCGSGKKYKQCHGRIS